MEYKIALMYGDGVGPELVTATTSLLRSVGFDPEYVTIEGGLEFQRRTGSPLSGNAFELIKESDAMLKGPVATPSGPDSFQSINVQIRKSFDLYVNFRPFRSLVTSKHPLVDILMFRENTEEAYSGIEWGSDSASVGLRIITRKASERIAEYAFNHARKNHRKTITVVHKATILKETDGLFRNAFFSIASNYPDLEASEILVDAAAYQLVRDPERFDTIVTPNSYGDILSDLIAGIVGSLGLCGSANIGDHYAVFEPAHGTAWDLANKDVANPTGMILSAVYMLQWLGESKSDSFLLRIASEVEKSTICILNRPLLTKELGGTASLSEFMREIERELDERL